MNNKILKQKFCVACGLLMTYGNPQTAEEMAIKEAADSAFFHLGNELLNKGVVSKPARGIVLYNRFIKELFKEDGEEFAIKAVLAIKNDTTPAANYAGLLSELTESTAPNRFAEMVYYLSKKEGFEGMVDCL